MAEVPTVTVDGPGTSDPATRAVLGPERVVGLADHAWIRFYAATHLRRAGRRPRPGGRICGCQGDWSRVAQAPESLARAWTAHLAERIILVIKWAAQPSGPGRALACALDCSTLRQQRRYRPGQRARPRRLAWRGRSHL